MLVIVLRFFYKCLPIFSNICTNIVGSCSRQICYKCFPIFSNICMNIVGTMLRIYNSDVLNLNSSYKFIGIKKFDEKISLFMFKSFYHFQFSINIHGIFCRNLAKLIICLLQVSILKEFYQKGSPQQFQFHLLQLKQ